MLTPRCALRMPLGLPVEPEEKNSSAGSDGCYDSRPGVDGARAKPRRHVARNGVPSSRSAPPVAPSSTMTSRRRNGKSLGEASFPGRGRSDRSAPARSSDRGEILGDDAAFEQQALPRRPEALSRNSRLGGVEKVDSPTAVARRGRCQRRLVRTHSRRLVIRMPTRSILAHAAGDQR